MAEGHLAIGPQGAIARIDAQGNVQAWRSGAVDADSTYVPRVLTGESVVAVAVLRSDGDAWDLWALERSQLEAAG